jgi:hypothetical protein
MKGPTYRELNSIQFICNSISHCLCAINPCTLDVGIIASVCGLPISPSSPEVRASSLHFHVTFPIGTTQDTTVLQHSSSKFHSIKIRCRHLLLNVTGRHFWNTLLTGKKEKGRLLKNVFCVCDSVTTVSAFEAVNLLP